MCPFKKDNIKDSFNAVIEGSFQEGWKTLHYKIAELQIPTDTNLLNDGQYQYRLFGRTEDFQTIIQFSGKGNILETRLESLSYCNGIILPIESSVLEYDLERPRAVCMRDGRIFVDNDMLDDKLYLDAFQKIVKNCGEIFQSEEYLDLRKKPMPFKA